MRPSVPHPLVLVQGELEREAQQGKGQEVGVEGACLVCCSSFRHLSSNRCPLAVVVAAIALAMALPAARKAPARDQAQEAATHYLGTERQQLAAAAVAATDLHLRGWAGN